MKARSVSRTSWHELASLPVLPRSFYEQSTARVARLLLGKVLLHGARAGRIVEVEAYLGPRDPAAHAFRGRTPRTEVLFGPPGHAYVYLIYGMYECLNVVAEPAGCPGCVLIRALEPMAGLPSMFAARPAARHPRDLCSGPGKLTRAMGITRQHYGADLTSGRLTIRDTKTPLPEPIIRSRRIGVRQGVKPLLRFYLKGNPFVSARPYQGE